MGNIMEMQNVECNFMQNMYQGRGEGMCSGGNTKRRTKSPTQ